MKTKILKHSLELYFPKSDNNGKSLDIIHNYITNKLINVFNGFTKLKTEGFWIKNLETYKDNIVIYKVSSEHPIKWDFICKILEFCFNNSDQKAIFLIHNGISIIIEK